MPKNLWIRIRYEKVHYYNLPEFVKDPDRCLLLDLLNDEMVACGYAKIVKDRPYLDHTHYACLGFMFVLQHRRGNGFNQQIQDRSVEWFQNRNIREIRLDVYTVNEAAIRT